MILDRFKGLVNEGVSFEDFDEINYSDISLFSHLMMTRAGLSMCRLCGRVMVLVTMQRLQ